MKVARFNNTLLIFFSNEQCSITITVKGLDRYVERILNTITTIDVSSNMFKGGIPSSIGALEALR